jgi:hypothetical protein
VPVRAVHPYHVSASRAVVPERGVLSVPEERESSVRQPVAAERRQRDLAEPRYLRAWGRHPATLTQAHDASNAVSPEGDPSKIRWRLAGFYNAAVDANMAETTRLAKTM